MPSLVATRRRGRSVESDEDPDTRENTPQSTGRNDTKRARRSLPNGNTATSDRNTPSPSQPITHPRSNHAKRVRPHAENSPFQPGSIVRVKLINFVTYTSAEFFPGPNLNMVIGPNGTGKSTLVCAICLGLGWGPQHLGRAKDVAEFVKHGCAEATIEIELAADPRRFRRNPVVCRIIKKEGNKSIFTVNGKTATKSGVLDLARSLSIQIDNLCQFLPQDKVVEFAAMTPIELLHSTQQAAGSPDMLEYHEHLKNFRTELRNISLIGKGDKELLTNLENRQEMARADVERFKQRAEVKEKIDWLERCRPIPLYREAHEAANAAKEKKKILSRELRQLKKEVEPALRSVNAKQEYHAQIRNVVQHRNQELQAVDRNTANLNTKIEKYDDKAKEVVHRHEAEVRGAKAKKEEQKRLQLGIRNLQKQMQDEPEPFDATEVNSQIREKVQEIRELKDRARDMREQADDLKRRGEGTQKEIKKIEEEIQKLDTSSGQQGVKLERRSRDTHTAWEWIKANQDKFEKQVFGPPMVECSLKDPKYADAVESLFQNNDFLFFTAQSRNDFRTLQRVLVHEKKLNDISLRVSSMTLDQFQPPFPEEQMRRLGFEGFALDHLAGPEPLLALLCSERRLHQTPIGFKEISEEQYQHIEKTGISSWVAGGHSYMITRRREYGDAGVSNRVRNLRRATVWTDQPVDIAKKRELSMQKAERLSDIEDIKKALAELNPSFQQAKAQAQELEIERQELQNEKDRRQKALSEFKALPTKLAQLEEKLETVNNILQSARERIAAAEDEHNEVLLKRAELTIKLADEVSKMRKLYTALLEAEILQIEAKSDYDTLVARNQEMNDMVKAKEQEEKEAIETQIQAADKAKSLVDGVKKLMEEGKENPRFQDFFQIISKDTTSEQLEANIDSEKAQLELIHETDPRAVTEFEDRAKQINKLRQDIEARQSRLDDVKAAIDEVRGKWEPELDKLVGKISDAFSDSFNRIGCAGQVSIYKASTKDDGEDAAPGEDLESGPGNGLDFGNWAIHIYVKFRENEPLCLLDSHRQSGGERAVSTIFYLMALQTLSRAPFRVVDEINQGMDPRNERMVHGRMVDIACGEDGQGSGSQYFLITPKLLSGLKYKRGMKVLCIVSGEQMPTPEQQGDGPGCIGKVDFRDWARRAQRLGMSDKRVDSGLGLDNFDQASPTTEVGA